MASILKFARESGGPDYFEVDFTSPEALSWDFFKTISSDGLYFVDEDGDSVIIDHWSIGEIKKQIHNTGQLTILVSDKVEFPQSSNIKKKLLKLEMDWVAADLKNQIKSEILDEVVRANSVKSAEGSVSISSKGMDRNLGICHICHQFESPIKEICLIESCSLCCCAECRTIFREGHNFDHPTLTLPGSLKSIKKEDICRNFGTIFDKYIGNKKEPGGGENIVSSEDQRSDSFSLVSDEGQLLSFDDDDEVTTKVEIAPVEEMVGLEMEKDPFTDFSDADEKYLQEFADNLTGTSDDVAVEPQKPPQALAEDPPDIDLAEETVQASHSYSSASSHGETSKPDKIAEAVTKGFQLVTDKVFTVITTAQQSWLPPQQNWKPPKAWVPKATQTQTDNGSGSHQILVDMGFSDGETNDRLMKKHDNDVSKVVNELLTQQPRLDTIDNLD